MNAVLSKKIKSHISFNWWKYLLLAAAFIAIWAYIFHLIGIPKDNEKIEICFVGDNVNDESLSEDISNALPSISKQYIEEVNIEVLNYADDYLMSITLATRLTGGTDFLIFEADKIGTLKNFIEPVDKEKFTAYFGELEFYNQDGVDYGFKISGKGKFSNYYSGSKECYVFFSPASVNLGDLGGKGKADDKAAIEILRYLLSEE